MTKFKLSDRFWTIQDLEQAKVFPLRVVSEFNIKEFIRLLKEDIDNPSGEINCSVEQMFRIIDNRTGDLK